MRRLRGLLPKRKKKKMNVTPAMMTSIRGVEDVNAGEEKPCNATETKEMKAAPKQLNKNDVINNNNNNGEGSQEVGLAAKSALTTLAAAAAVAVRSVFLNRIAPPDAGKVSHDTLKAVNDHCTNLGRRDKAKG